MHDLAVIIVSTNEAHWLRPCLSTLFATLGNVKTDVVVADNSSTDGTRELVETDFPGARVVTCTNYGFGHANNRGLMTTDARYVLFLNPDTEIRTGTFEELVAYMDAAPHVGLVGVKQITADGELFPTIRRFPNAIRAASEALGSERYPIRSSWMGERELDLTRYELEVSCDWTSGSFMLARREALDRRGDLRRAVLPVLGGDRPVPEDQAGRLGGLAFAAHDDRPSRSEGGREPQARGAGRTHTAAIQQEALLARPPGRISRRLAFGYGLRSVAPRRERRSASRAALASLFGLTRPPFREPVSVALVEDAPS